MRVVEESGSLEVGRESEGGREARLGGLVEEVEAAAAAVTAGAGTDLAADSCGWPLSDVDKGAALG